jgi:hypothetical protein
MFRRLRSIRRNCQATQERRKRPLGRLQLGFTSRSFMVLGGSAIPFLRILLPDRASPDRHALPVGSMIRVNPLREASLILAPPLRRRSLMLLHPLKDPVPPPLAARVALSWASSTTSPMPRHSTSPAERWSASSSPPGPGSGSPPRIRPATTRSAKRSSSG